MTDQATQGLFSPLLRRRRLAIARPYLQGRVLDYGCGTGALAEDLLPANYVGYDMDPDSVLEARRSHPEHEFTSDVVREQEAFDTVVSLAVIEHVDDPAAFLSGLVRYCRHPGTIVITTPNPMLDPLHHVGAMLGLFSKEASHEHVSLLDRKALLELARSVGLEVVRYARFLGGANQLLVARK